MTTKVRAAEPIDRAGIEQALWRWTGWQADQRLVDEMLTLVDRYAAGSPEPWPCHVPDWRGRLVPIAEDCEHADEPGGLPATLTSVPGHTLPLQGFMDAEGALWVRLGAIPDDSVPVDERRRKCTRCGARKPIARYRKDRKSMGGRKRQCMDCENVRRRANEAKKREG